VSLDRPGSHTLRTALVQSVTRSSGGHDGNGRLSFDHDVRLHLIARSLWKLRQVKKALAILGQKCSYVYECHNPLATACRSVCGNDSAHAVADNNGRLGIGCQRLTQSVCARI